jgi:hypothetical protein
VRLWAYALHKANLGRALEVKSIEEHMIVAMQRKYQIYNSIGRYYNELASPDCRPWRRVAFLRRVHVKQDTRVCRAIGTRERDQRTRISVSTPGNVNLATSKIKLCSSFTVCHVEGNMLNPDEVFPIW